MKISLYGKNKEVDSSIDNYINPEKSAVISIDMNRSHLDEDCPCPAPRAREIIEPINLFHNKIRNMNIPIIHIKSSLRKNGIDDINGLKAAWRTVFPLHVGNISNSDEHALEGTKWSELVTDVNEKDLIVQTKKRLTAFYPSDLDFLLRNIGAKTIILNGGMTDCCILNSAFDASNLGYKVIVLSDLVRGTNEEMESAALKIISIHLGLVMDSNEFIKQTNK